MTTATAKPVSPFDARLLSIAQAIVGATPHYADIAALQTTRHIHSDPQGPPFGATEPALGLLQRTLARGVVLSLLRKGGWQRSRFVVDGEIRSGRLWDRHRLTPLRFSGYTFELLRWMAFRTASSAQPETVGDHLFAYLAADHLRRSTNEAWPALLGRAPLPWLAWPHRFAAKLIPPGQPEMAWLVSHARLVLEALQFDLTRKVVALETSKGAMSIERLIPVGEVQETALAAYLDATEEDPDLTRFICDAGACLVGANPSVERWFNPPKTASLAQRAVAARAAAAFFRILERRQSWNQRFVAVRFFDDDYDRAQLYLEDWARLGGEGYARLRGVAAALESMAPMGRSSTPHETD